MDVSLPVLHSSLQSRVDRMIEAGQVDEVREFFDPFADYTRGIRRAIGVPEFDEFLRAEAAGADEGTKKRLLESAIARIKVNNCTLASRQLQKIQRLYSMCKRSVHRLDPTEVFLNRGSESEAYWEEHVLAKSLRIVHKFLYEEERNNNKHVIVPVSVSTKDVIGSVSSSPAVAMAAVATATH